MKKALVLTLALALGLGFAAFAGPLSGEWSSDITIAPQQTNSFTGFDSTITVDYTVGGWVFESVTGFSLTGWEKQAFSANGVLGAFTLDSDLVFSPSGASFTSWDSTGSVSIAGVSLNGEFLLGATGSGWTFGASGGAGDLSLGANVYFNSKSTSSGLALDNDEYCFCFTSVDFDASFPFACIDLVDVSVAFSDEGFDGITFSATGIAVPSISWLTFDADLTFDDGTAGKSLTLTPNINLGDFTCITLYYGLLTAGTYQITGIDFYGIGLEYSWNGVSFSSQSSFASAKNEGITGKAAYWEKFSIASAADSCCGGGFSFSLDTYFKTGSTLLFDWGETDASIKYGLGSNFTVSTGLNVTDDGFSKWTLGFDVTW